MNARERTRFDMLKRAGDFGHANAAGFGLLLGEGFGMLKSLDAIMHNFHNTDAAIFVAWRTASHIERQPKTKKPSATPAPPQA